MSNLQRDVYLRSDIENALEAIRHTNEQAMRRIQSVEGSAYREGFNDALSAVAIAFNLRTRDNVQVIEIEPSKRGRLNG